MNNDFLNDYIDGLYRQAQYISTSSEEYEIIKQAGWIGKIGRGLWSGGKYVVKALPRDVGKFTAGLWSGLGRAVKGVTGGRLGLPGAKGANRFVNRVNVKELKELEDVFGSRMVRGNGFVPKAMRRFVAPVLGTSTATAGAAVAANAANAAVNAVAPEADPNYADNNKVEQPNAISRAITGAEAGIKEWYAEDKVKEMAKLTAKMPASWKMQVAANPDAAYEVLREKLKNHFWAPFTDDIVDMYVDGLKEDGGRGVGIGGLLLPDFTKSELKQQAVNGVRRYADSIRTKGGLKAKYDPEQIKPYDDLTSKDWAPFGIAAGGLGLLALNNMFNSDSDEPSTPAPSTRERYRGGSPSVPGRNRLYGTKFDKLYAADDLDYTKPL